MDKSFIKGKIALLLQNRYLIIALLALIFIIAFIPKNKSVDSTVQSDKSRESFFIGDEFENKLEDILSEIRGVKNASVLLSYEGGIKYIYAADINKTESEGRTTSSKDTVIAGGEAVMEGSINPQITGAVVVYSGTRSSSVRLDILDAVMSATGLSSDKITVLCGG